MEPQIFNVYKKRPIVLLFGNGLFHNECDWNGFIRKCSKKEENRVDFSDERLTGIPYSIKANICCDFDDENRRRNYCDILAKMRKDNAIYETKYDVMNSLLDLPFDAILTTNYTYQLENALNPDFINQSDKTKQKKYSVSLGPKPDHTFLIHTFNAIDSHRIWHVHGEERRKSSIVLTHDEYGRLVTAILQYFREAQNKYVKYADELIVESWIDYLMIGDVYVLGYGLDFSEFDMWWLLGRRMREKGPKGKLVFYEPQNVSDKENNLSKLYALRQMGVDVETLGFQVNDTSFDYKKFYHSAIENIRSKLK